MVPPETLHALPLDPRKDVGQILLHRRQEQAIALLLVRVSQLGSMNSIKD